MRAVAVALALLPACSAVPAGVFTTPLPGTATQGTETQGAVEVFVAANHPALINDITNGGGDALSTAMILAGVPLAEHATRTLQLAADLPLYTRSPAALTTQLLIYGSAA